jgi:predicted NAD/FAD-binding protein
LASFQGKVATQASIRSVSRREGKICVRTDTQALEYDKVVLACHANESLALLNEPTELEQKLLGTWSYQRNHTVLHTDVSVLPPNQKAWASWNYVHEKGTGEMGKTSLTYDMNRLQGLKTQRHYLVTLNRSVQIEKSAVVKEFQYTHPTYSLGSVASQKDLPRLNGVQNTYFCGSYFGFGFHEDAVKSAVEVGKALGVEL